MSEGKTQLPVPGTFVISQNQAAARLLPDFSLDPTGRRIAFAYGNSDSFHIFMIDLATDTRRDVMGNRLEGNEPRLAVALHDLRHRTCGHDPWHAGPRT